MKDTAPLDFNGNFSDEHRNRLNWLLKSAGMKPKDLATLINCSDSACRLWLKGKNNRCKTRFIPAFQILFSGSLDELFLKAGHLDRVRKEQKQARENTHRLRPE